jgi:hypothetical protein
VISDLSYRYAETGRNHQTYVQVQEGDEYALVINNPLPVRVAVAVTIDGLNVIDGKRTSPDKAQKWMIDAHSSLALRGWQTGRTSLRRFVFTRIDDSYAQWKGERDRKPYTRNLGVIGVAWFWNSAELDAALRPPMPFVDRFDECTKGKSLGGAAQASESRSAPSAAPREEKAGTGMGHSEVNHVVDVEFRYDAGMYRTRDVLTMYYEFAQNYQYPQPFSDEEDRRIFSPEMPN